MVIFENFLKESSAPLETIGLQLMILDPIQQPLEPRFRNIFSVGFVWSFSIFIFRISFALLAKLFGADLALPGAVCDKRLCQVEASAVK